MTTTACDKKWGGLFSVGEDFDDEDLLEADWTHAPENPSVTGSSAAPASAPLKESATFSTHNAQQSSPSLSTSSLNSSSETGSLAPLGLQEPSVVKGLRSLSNPNSSSHCPSDPHKPTTSLRAPLGGSCIVSSLQSPSAQSNPPPAVHSAPPQDDFDEWDVDLEELDENLFQKASGPAPDTDSISPAKRMKSSAVAEDTSVVSSLRGFCSSAPTSRPPQSFIRTPGPSTFAPQGPPPSPCQPFVRNSSVCQFSSPGPVRASGEGQRGVVTPRASQGHQKSLFQAISPAPSQTRTPRPLNTPVLTNHLVQLVSAASKTPQRPRSDAVRSKTRRFPGPAGALPQQISGRNLDDIVVTVPQTPAHGAVARLQNEVPRSQVSEEEEFSGGPWAAMKAEMGLDERNPSCFLHSYSIVMVLRKAALRQLAKNKVPNMAVVLKSILHTHADGKAVFRDPTGEIQGTVHRRLLEDRQGELKTGAVLLLKQVGVFSPSHRNHYLNVTPNNLLKIYPPDGALPSSSQLAQPVLDAVGLPQCESSRPIGVPVSQMELHYDDDEEEGDQSANPANPASSANMVVQPSGPEATEEALWGSDDLDELLGELPVE
ncbi:homologous recombination OB-fold protein [Colossoma macropomum]|uniref:homologous recombination OB-fold protein n=1 Tax=Colossoma macropomum TaxID=42526 RepID=UPI001863A6ED|nr:homologous recombination OB-fold protein [Colossoma macropomum]